MQFQHLILAGGSGTRLWPLSRSGFPKQFLSFGEKESLFQQTVNRLHHLDIQGTTQLPAMVITNEEHRFLANEQLREIGQSHVDLLLEPVGRNTAPALTLSALQADPDTIFVVTPADQAISDKQVFRETIQVAINEANKSNAIVVLGIVPESAHTGYGYIESGKFNSGIGEVVSFKEKPDLAVATNYLTKGNYFWNAGIFVVRASVWLAALSQFRNDIYEATYAAASKLKVDENFHRPDKGLFQDIPAESIDYAVIEKCPGSDTPISMVSLDAGWSDLGAWDSVWENTVKDNSNNVFIGDVLSFDTTNSYVHSLNSLVGVVGLDNVVVVETADALLVSDKSRCQDVKQIVDALKFKKREESLLHRKVCRPWGWYDSLDEGDKFKVKRILVKPGASLSLQKHHHRAEHWIVVSGVAEVVCGETTLTLNENQSTYIPQGEVHRLSNPGTLPLEVIEVQSGSYLGEDDIVRLEDRYGRTPSDSE